MKYLLVCLLMLSGIASQNYSNAATFNDTLKCRQYLRSGYAKMNANNVEEAIADYTKAIGYNPNSWIAYQYRGYAYKAAKKYTEALEDFSKAIAINNKDVRSYRGRGDAKQFNGDYKDAITDYNSALFYNLPDTSYESLIGRAYCYYKLRKFKESIQDYSLVIARYGSEYPSAYFKRGMAYLDSKDYKKAEDDFSVYLAINGTEPYAAYYQRGVSYLHQLKPDYAIYDFRLYLKTQSPDPLLYHYLALAHALKKDSINAREYYQRSIEKDLGGNVSYIYSEWARLEYDWGYYQLSAVLSQRSIANAKKRKESVDPLWYYTYGLALVKIKDTVHALESFKNAVDLKSDYYSAYEERVKLVGSKASYALQNSKDLTIMIDLVRGNEDKAKLYAARSYVKMSAKDNVGSKNDIDKAIELDPGNALFYIDRVNNCIHSIDRKISDEARRNMFNDINNSIYLNNAMWQSYFFKAILLSFFGNKKSACDTIVVSNQYGLEITEEFKNEVCKGKINTSGKLILQVDKYFTRGICDILPLKPVLVSE